MILIAGDSWGEGQWIDHSNSLTPRWPGFHHYWVQNQVPIENISFGGYSNHQAVSALDMRLAHKNLFSNLTVIIWLTCTLRDYPIGIKVSDIDQWIYSHYENVFDRLISIAQKYQCCIKIMGGLGDIPRSFSSELSSRVSIILHSTSKFVNPEYQFELPYGHITLIDNVPDVAQRHKIFVGLEKKFNYMQSRRDIYHDGVHFGSSAYQKIHNYVQSQI
jgi:hypothetical protein